MVLKTGDDELHTLPSCLLPAREWTKQEHCQQKKREEGNAGDVREGGLSGAGLSLCSASLC